MSNFYDLSEEAAKKLNQPWVASYSGGKDSTSLCTWLEWLRRTEQIEIMTPQLVLSDTGVEFESLKELTTRFMEAMTKSGWNCHIVQPKTRDKLYCQIFGKGNTPVHPAIKGMRWCTRATKTEPMEGYQRTLGKDILCLSGVRWGESKIRDDKLGNRGCVIGGECGTPTTGDNLFAPIVNWRTCQVIDWLDGLTAPAKAIKNLLPLTKELVSIYYDQQQGRKAGFLDAVSSITESLRFGCMGCPAISIGPSKLKQAHNHSNLGDRIREIYWIWDQVRLNGNRCWRFNSKKNAWQRGPIKMEVRKLYYPMILQIQQDTSVVLVTPEDDAFIRDCWKKKVYPKGWTEKDELTPIPKIQDLIQVGFLGDLKKGT